MKTGVVAEKPMISPNMSDLIKVSRVVFLGAGPHGRALSMGWPVPVFYAVENIIYGNSEVNDVSDKYELLKKS